MCNLTKTKKLLVLTVIIAVLSTFCGCSNSSESIGDSQSTSSVVSKSTDEKTDSVQLTVSKDDEFTSSPREEDENTMAIHSYEGNANIVNIPEELEGKPVAEIAGYILRGNENVVEINVPDSVTEITGRAFQFCTKLEKFDMGNGVTTIGENLFLRDNALKEVKLSRNLTEIPRGTFINCTSLETIVIPNKVTKIKYASFGNCTSLKEIHMTDSVTSIEDEEDVELNVFSGCDDLTIYAPAGSYAESYAKKKNIPFVAE